MYKIHISEIKPNEHNPRDITEDKFAKLVKSIQDFPQMLEVRPLVIDEDNVVLGGNMRLKALQKAGVTEVPVEQVINWTEEQKKEFIIKDNIGYGEWDWDMLANEWDKDELEDWGLELHIEEDEELEAEEDDYEMPPEDQIETDIVIGDVFEIGQHRLMCGDSTSVDDVDKLMDGEKADLAHNDPPYGMKKEKDGVLNDNLNYDDLLDFNRQWIALQFTALKDNGSWYCWGIDEPLMDIYSHILKPYIKEQKATFRNLITWDKFFNQKPTAIEGMRSYVVYEEKCLFAMCGVQGFNNNSDNYFEGWEPIRQYLESEMEKVGGKKAWKEALGNQMGSHYFTKSQWTLPTEEAYKKLQSYANGDAFKRKYDELKREYYSTRSYFNNTHETYMTSVWRFEHANKVEREDIGQHATPKPIALCERAIKSSCPESGLVLDFFLGSGSTMVACHQLNRKCYGMELDPKYCQVIIDRMKKLDPELVIKKNGEIVN